MITNARDFGMMIVRARKALGLTQRDLALAINTGERFKHRIIGRERGMSNARSSPPFGLGMWSRRDLKLMYSILTVLIALGREPLSNVNK